MISAVDNITVLPEGQPGATLLMSGRWNENKEYTRDNEIIALVEFDGLFYSLNKKGITQGGLTPKDDYAKFGSKATWKLQPSYEMIIVKAIVADGGLVGEFVFWDGKMMSQQGVDREGNPSTNYEAFRTGDFTPNLLFDAITGNIVAVRGQFGLLYIIDGDIVGLGTDNREVIRISSSEIPQSHLLDGIWKPLEDNRICLDEVWMFDTTSRPVKTSYSTRWEEYIDCSKIGEYEIEDLESRLSYNSKGLEYKNTISHSVLIYFEGVLISKTEFGQYGSCSFYAKKAGRYKVICNVYTSIDPVHGSTPDQSMLVSLHSEIMSILFKESPKPTTLLGKDGLYSSFTSSEYIHYKAGFGFTIKAGAFGLKISSDGIKKWNGNQWVAANI